MDDQSFSSSRTPIFGPTELRVVLALCQALAIGLTWHLWQVRTELGDASNLPLIDAPWVSHVQFSLGWPLLASLVLAAYWPRFGIAAHCGLLALGIALDQMRIQPEFVSVAILLVGTLPGNGPKQLARCHLISLWFWAGLHKLLSPGYLFDSGPRMWNDTVGTLSERQAFVLAIVAAGLELTLGLLAVFPRTRRFVAWLAAVLHFGILLSLIVQNWNQAVWPWNVALIVAAAGYFLGWKGPLIELTSADDAGGQESRALSRRISWGWAAAAVFALVHPALYYVGLSDAYVSWCVYSSNTPEARHYSAADLAGFAPSIAADSAELAEALGETAGTELQFRHYESVHVPFPPASRLFEQHFRHVGVHGDVLTIDDPRPGVSWLGKARRVLLLTEQGVIELPVP